MKSLIFWGLIGCSVYYYNRSNKAQQDMIDRQASQQANTQIHYDAEQRQHESEMIQQRMLAYQAHIDAERIQASIDDAAFQARMDAIANRPYRY
jgi:hypothetical protein